MLLSAVKVVFLEQHQAQIVVRLRPIGAVRQNPAELRHGFVQLCLASQGDGQILPRLEQLWKRFEGSTEFPLGQTQVSMLKGVNATGQVAPRRPFCVLFLGAEGRGYTSDQGCECGYCGKASCVLVVHRSVEWPALRLP